MPPKKTAAAPAKKTEPPSSPSAERLLQQITKAHSDHIGDPELFHTWMAGWLAAQEPVAG